MRKKIGELSVRDKFTLTGLVSVSAQIFTVEQFLPGENLVVARDSHGWGRAFDVTETVYPWYYAEKSD